MTPERLAELKALAIKGTPWGYAEIAAVISGASELTEEVERLDRELHLTRAELDETRGALERARDLAVRSGVFTRDDDEHSEAQRSPWEGVTL